MKIIKKFFIILLVSNLIAVEIRLFPPSNFKIDNKKIFFTCATSKIFTEEVINFINKGVTTTFSYYIIFYKQKLFFDTEIKKIIVNKRVEYDIWSEIYQIETDYPKKKRLYYKKLKALKKQITVLDYLYMIDQNDIDKKGVYYFKSRMTLKITQLYSYMHLLFNFLSIFKYKTTYIKGKDFKGKYFHNLK